MILTFYIVIRSDDLMMNTTILVNNIDYAAHLYNQNNNKTLTFIFIQNLKPDRKQPF